MSCCNKTRALPPNPVPLSLKDLDLWLYSGFDGLINLFQKRGLSNPAALSKENLEILRVYVNELEAYYNGLNGFSELELDNNESDALLLKCLSIMLVALQRRTENSVKHKETLQLLKTNLDKMKGILVGFETLDFRAQDPYQQGIRDSRGGWINRGSKLYGHAHEVAEYEKGYSTIRKI